MKTTIRFVMFIAAGLFAYIFWLTGFVLLFMEVLAPSLHLTDGQQTFAAWMSIILATLSGGILFSYWFVKPIAAMMKLVGDISAGNNHVRDVFQKIYKKNGKLKLKYWLYRELVSDVSSLAVQLRQAETEREKIEQAKRDWVRGISHDIKTPLSYVVGYSSLLASDYSWSEEERRSFLSQIHQKGKYIESLINNLNLSLRLEDHAKPMPLQISTFDLIGFVNHLAADMLNQHPSADYPISVQALDANLHIEADEQLLYRALANLVDNAVSHNAIGTKVEIELKRHRQSGVSITVRDDGAGMPQEAANGLFDQYYDSKTTASGKKDYTRGLGLSIVKSIVEAHKGEIIVESTENGGMAFLIHLPLKLADIHD